MPILIILFALLLGLPGPVQGQTNTLPPDVQKMMKMTPAEREKYAEELKKKYTDQVKEMSKNGPIAVDETILPGYEVSLPVRDARRLAMIPKEAQNRAALLHFVQTHSQKLSAIFPPAKLNECKALIQHKTADLIQVAALGKFFGKDPVAGIWLMMEAVKLQPDSLILWNNLAGLYTMTGLEHRAIPLLLYCHRLEPESSMVLNNIGQAYLGLGDITSAKKFLQDALAADSLNPDANHSMGMIHLAAKEYPQARQCLSREMTVCVRKSTVSLIGKTGSEISFLPLFTKRQAYSGREKKNHFEEIELGKFRLPDFPATMRELEQRRGELEAFAASVAQEAFYWNGISFTKDQMEAEGREPISIYHDWVEKLLDELHKEFTPEFLVPITENDADGLIEIMTRHSKAVNEVKCPEAPFGSSVEAQQAYIIKCCEEQKRPKYDQMISEYGSYIRPKLDAAQDRWKFYINALIDIARLNPSLGNQLMVYKAVGGYFNFLHLASGYAWAGNMSLPDCIPNYNKEKNDSLISSNRNWLLACPAWLNLDWDVVVAKIKADCGKYGFEIGAGLYAEYEHNFKTGTTTFAAGAGLKAKFFANTGKAGIKAAGYISIDSNGEICDYGVKAKAEVGIADSPVKIGDTRVGGTIGGVEGGFTLGVNSGFNPSVKGQGLLADLIKIDKSL